MSEVLSIYTPSNLKPEILEKIFVQRHKLLDKSVQWIEESIVTKKKNHLLFVGSRGSGKTHLISMIINRLKAKEELENKMVLVWLGEDDVITNFLDFVLSILRTMAEGSEFNLDCLDVAKGKGHNEAVDIILDSIMKQLGNRILLVVKENMSDVFSGLKDDGQKKLRAFLQENKNMVLLTSSQQLFEGVSSRDAAFFGFFDIHHLKPLSVDDAMELIAKVSKLKGDQELYDFVHTSQGRYRVRALHHLAGGNQRLYMNLLEFLTMESLDNLVSALNKLADDLTPYFQERIKSLPPQQGKIVQKLCDIEGALPVKSIAEELFIGERSVSKQLGELKSKNYVLAHKRGKQTYYEIAEPLMRLSLEVKHNHGKPLKMLVLLLRAWFSDKELKINLFENTGTVFFNYVEEALNMDKTIISNLCEKMGQELLLCVEDGNNKRAIKVASELISSPDKLLYLEDLTLIIRADSYVKENEIELAIEDYMQVIKLDIVDEKQKSSIYTLLSFLFYKEDKYSEAIQYIKKALNTNINNDVILKLIRLRVNIYEKIDEVTLSISDYTKLIELDKNNIFEFLLKRSHLYAKEYDYKNAQYDITNAIEMPNISDNQKSVSLVMRAIYFLDTKKYDLAITDLLNCLLIKNIPDIAKINALFILANLYYIMQKFSKGYDTLSDAFEFRNRNDIQNIVHDYGILNSIIKSGFSNWENEISFLLPLYDKYKVMEYLSENLINTIDIFIHDDILLLHFNRWQELWQKEASDYEFMETPLKVLRVVREALEDKSDKPLFELPKEIRDLVLPLIEDAIK